MIIEPISLLQGGRFPRGHAGHKATKGPRRRRGTNPDGAPRGSIPGGAVRPAVRPRGHERAEEKMSQGRSRVYRTRGRAREKVNPNTTHPSTMEKRGGPQTS